MTAVVSAAALRPTHPAIPAASALPRSEESRADRRRYVPYPEKGITNAMLKQFAPIAVTPPSPNRRAWMTRAMLIESVAPHGPTAIAIRTPPTACPVLPPGRGRLNIITRKENAAEMARRGALRASRLSRTLRAAIAQRGAQAAYAAVYVGGPRYPSGMCISYMFSYLVLLPPPPGGSRFTCRPSPFSSPGKAMVTPARYVMPGDASVVPQRMPTSSVRFRASSAFPPTSRSEEALPEAPTFFSQRYSPSRIYRPPTSHSAARLALTLSSRSRLPMGRPAMVAPVLTWIRTAPISQSAMTVARPLARPGPSPFVSSPVGRTAPALNPTVGIHPLPSPNEVLSVTSVSPVPRTDSVPSPGSRNT